MNSICLTIKGNKIDIVSSRADKDFSTLLFLLMTGKLNDKIIKECVDFETQSELSNFLVQSPIIRAGEYK